MKKSVLIGFIILVTSLFLLQGCASKTDAVKYTDEQIEKLAQCLTDEGTVMYGAFWCPHCAKTKKRFGSSFEYVTYVECDPKCKPDEDGTIIPACKGYEGQPELCLEKGIEGYDTWVFADDTRLVGEPSFEELDKGSGCNILGGEVA